MRDWNNHYGWVEVICGCMFSGKTEELIRRMTRAQIARQKLQVFKPALDDQVGRAWLSSIHPDDLDEATERHGAYAVLDAVAVRAPDTRTEPEEELGGLHPAPAGGPEVTELVEHDRQREADDREAARLAALKRQQEIESVARRAWTNRLTYPSDYKPREHYYMRIDLQNIGATPPTTENPPEK